MGVLLQIRAGQLTHPRVLSPTSQGHGYADACCHAGLLSLRAIYTSLYNGGLRITKQRRAAQGSRSTPHSGVFRWSHALAAGTGPHRPALTTTRSAAVAEPG